MDKYFCCCCDQELAPVGKYYVCHRCKTVAFTEDIPFEEKCNAINQYLDDVQKKISTKRDELYKLEQKYTLKEELTAEEQEMHEKLSEFQAVFSDLKIILYSGSDAATKRIKMSLYRLLMISDWLREKLELEK